MTLVDKSRQLEEKDKEFGEGGQGGMKQYWKNRNEHSIDGLIALTSARNLQTALASAPPRTEVSKKISAYRSPNLNWISSFVSGFAAALILVYMTTLTRRIWGSYLL